MAKRRKKIHNIVIVGRRWCRQIGGTYCTAEIIVNGEHVHKTPPTGGYDDHYVTEALEWLGKEGYLHPWDEKLPRHRIAELCGFPIYVTAADVVRERDL